MAKTGWFLTKNIFSAIKKIIRNMYSFCFIARPPAATKKVLPQKSLFSLTKGVLMANCNLILKQGVANDMRTRSELYRTTPRIYPSEWKNCPQCGHELVEMHYLSGLKTVQTMAQAMTIAYRPKRCPNLASGTR